MGRGAGGFSLLEMLLVLFVIAVITSLVSLNVGSGGNRELEQQLRALRDVAAYALDEAQYSGHDFGMLLLREADDEGVPRLWLRWRERLPQGWRPVERSREVFADMTVPPDTEFELYLDGSSVLPADEDASQERAGVEPQWLFYASGETDSGEMLWRDAGDGRLLWRLSWDALGRFQLYRGSEADETLNAPL